MTKINQLREHLKKSGAGRAGNSAKGNEFEKEVADYLIARGFMVQRAIPSVKPYYRKARGYLGGMRGWRTVSADFFGCIDMIAFHPDSDVVHFIQCTTAEKLLQTKIDEINGVFKKFSRNRRVQVWVKENYNLNFAKIACMTSLHDSWVIYSLKEWAQIHLEEFDYQFRPSPSFSGRFA